MLIAMLLPRASGAHDVIHLDSDQTDYDASIHGVAFPDPDGQFNAENVDELVEKFRSGALSGAAEHTEQPTHRYWFLFEVENGTPKPDWMLSLHSPLIRRARLFDFDASGSPAVRATGYDIPVANRIRPALDYALPLSIGPTQTELVALLIEDPAGQLPGAGDIRLETDERFRTQTFRMIAVALLSLGGVLAVGLYMLLIWLRLRERTYLWFGCFAISSFVLWATHYELFRLLLGHSYDFTLLNLMSNAASLLFCVLFVRSFLDVDRWSHRWKTVAIATVCGLLLLIGATPMLEGHVAYLANATAALWVLFVVIAVGISAVFKRIEGAGTFLAAWSVYFSTGLLTIIDALGVGLPTVNVRLLTVGAVALGTLLMAWSVGNQLQELISQKRIAELRARTDALTQLGNRASFDDQLEHFQHQYDADLLSDLLVLFADLDGLKRINDTRGHDVGDELLRDFARSLEERFRNVDGIFRVGGDEFVLLLPDARPAFATWMPDRIDDIISELRQMGYTQASVSVGIAMLSEADGDARNAVRLADERMYEHKDSSG